MKFTKMQGLGNDFVVIEGDEPGPSTIRELCHRRFGVGADGVLLVDDSPRMRYWNADGTRAEMCGNGLRCVARYAVDRKWAAAGEWMTILTDVGVRRARVDAEGVTVEIGPVKRGGTVQIGGRTYHQASTGNPHAVTLIEDPDLVDVTAIGQAVSGDVAFPEGANVEFVKLEGPTRIRLRVWERGVGETLACGSGMVAAAAVSIGTSHGPIAVEVLGGDAEVRFERDSGYLTGPAEYVFRGEWPSTEPAENADHPSEHIDV